MVYIALTNSYKDYNKAAIESFTFHKNGKIVFTYYVFLTDENILFNKMISITDAADVLKIKSASYSGYDSYDAICRALLEKIIKDGLESGNIEVM